MLNILLPVLQALLYLWAQKIMRDRSGSTTGSPRIGLRDHLRLEVSRYFVESVQSGVNCRNRSADDVNDFSDLYCVRGLISNV